MSVSLFCLRYAESTLAERQVYDGGREGVYHPIAFAFYLLQTDGRTVLVDTGCDDMPDFDMKEHRSPVAVLAEIGVSPADVTDVVLTHAHHDHVGGARHFPDATFYLSRAEYKQAAAYLPQGARYVLFEREYRLTDRVRIVEIGGHTVGSCVVEVAAEDGAHLLTGDECYLLDNLTHRRHTGATYDHAKADAFTETYGDGSYRVHTCHDIGLKTKRIL